MMRFNLAFLLILICAALSAQETNKPEIKDSERQGMLKAAFQEFAFKRIQGFEEMPLKWNMAGKIQADLNEGINDLLEENPADAEASLTKVIEADSSVWQAYYFRSAARKQLKQYKAATKDLERTIKLQPGLYEAYVELAKIYFFRGNDSESERMIRKAIQLDKSKPAAHYIKGDINLIQNQIGYATRNFKDCLALDSLFHDARLKLAIIDLFEKKNDAQALVRFSTILRYDSLQKNALLFRAILEMDNNKPRAVRDLSNLIMVSPNHVMARYLRGTLYTQLENYELAFSDLKEVITLTSVDENEFDGEQTWVDKKIDIQNVGAYTLTRMYGLSEADVIKVKQAYCLIVCGKFDMGVGTLNQVKNPEKEPLCLYLIAVAYEHKGSHQKALQFYHMALKLDDDIADAHKKRGLYEQELQLWDKSIDDFTTVLRLNPDMYMIYKYRGYSYFMKNMMKETIDDMTEFLKHDTVDSDVYSVRAKAHKAINKPLEAYYDFAKAGNFAVLNDFDKMTSLLDSVLIAGDTTKVLLYANAFLETSRYYSGGWAIKLKIFHARKNWDALDENIKEALKSVPIGPNKPDYAYVLTLQAITLARKGDKDDAIETLSEAIKVDRKNAWAYLERGKLYLEMGKASKAESDFQQASALGNSEAKKLVKN